MVVNLASGSEDQKGAVMAHGWPALLLAHMADPSPKVRVAAVWAVINLSWRCGGAVGGAGCMWWCVRGGGSMSALPAGQLVQGERSSKCVAASVGAFGQSVPFCH